MKLLDLANDIRDAIGLTPDEDFRPVERRREPRREISGRKVLVRQRMTLGVLHLKNLSSNGGCGITEMPLAVGSLVFLQLRKPLFQAAEVRWARSLAIGLEFLRPLRPEMYETPGAPPAEPKRRKARQVARGASPLTPDLVRRTALDAPIGDELPEEDGA